MNYRVPASFGLEDDLGFWLRLVSIQWSALMKEALRGPAVTEAEMLILRTIFEKSYTTQHAVRRSLGIGKAETSKVLRRLEQRGFIFRQLADGHLRFQWLMLTPQGEELIPALVEIANDSDDRLFARLGPDDRAVMVRACKTVLISKV